MRTWTFDRLSSIDDIETKAPGGIHQSSSLLTTPSEKPFILYRFGVNNPELEGGDKVEAFSQSVTIYVHGIVGDYQPIDDLLKDIRQVLEGSSDRVLAARFLIESEDMRDPEMGTILRFARYQLIHTPEEA